MARKVIGTGAVFLWMVAIVSAQFAASIIEPGHPAIGYPGASSDSVAQLNRRLQAGEVRLEFDARTGYLRSLLGALEIPVESQIALFSGTSLQARLVNAKNPRTIFFNDSTVVAWMAGGFIEAASLDPRQGAMFYLLQQAPAAAPQLARDVRCLQCHYASATLGVPGFLVRSIPSTRDGMILPWLGNYTTDHRSPLSERWGGWYVTGRGGGRHLGNAPVADRTLQDLRVEESNLNVATLADRFDTSEYLSQHSDIAALLVFDHQMRMMNLLTRLGWEARILEHERRLSATTLEEIVTEVVDYMLFVDEAPIDAVHGSSAFAKGFSRRGPRDSKGRSLRDLDLQQRLLRYPCSYMIYSEAFIALPDSVRSAVYARLWRVLSGSDAAPKYAKLAAADRQAIIEILRDTKTDLPGVFRPAP
jgi:hypothetical protein